MRAGENVHILFISMFSCFKTSDLELKKLPYFYLVTYSAQEPEQAIMAVNTFVQDAEDPSPVVGALAVRTMCRIRLESVADYMVILLSDQLQFILNEATKDSNVPDVKNRAIVYWRVLSADPQVAKNVVIFGKQTVMHSGVNFDDQVLEELIDNMGTVSGVLHVVPSDFVSRDRYSPEDYETNGIGSGSLINDFGSSSSMLRIWKQLRLNNDSFIEVFVDFDRNNMYLRLVNKSTSPLSDFAFAINKNVVGLTISGQAQFPQSLADGDVCEVTIPIVYDASLIGNNEQSDLQLALRTSMGDVFAVCRIPFEYATIPEGEIGETKFKEYFTNLSQPQNVLTFVINDTQLADENQLKKKNVFIVGRNGNKLYVSFMFPSKATFVAEIEQNQQNINVIVKGTDPTILPMLRNNSQFLFSAK